MSALLQNLKNEFQDEAYRYAYAESFLNTKLAAQIRTLREQRDKTQAEIAAKMGIKQPGYRRFEDSNHAVWKTDSLWTIARALGVRLSISFETFGTLPEEKERFNKESLRRPDFQNDPVFNDQLMAPEAGTVDLGKVINAVQIGSQSGIHIVPTVLISNQHDHNCRPNAKKRLEEREPQHHASRRKQAKAARIGTGSPYTGSGSSFGSIAAGSAGRGF